MRLLLPMRATPAAPFASEAYRFAGKGNGVRAWLRLRPATSGGGGVRAPTIPGRAVGGHAALRKNILCNCLEPVLPAR